MTEADPAHPQAVRRRWLIAPEKHTEQKIMNLMEKTRLRAAYRQQKANARHRGIEWQFEYGQWLHMWRESGHLADRGVTGYVMARYNDEGPYSPDNCEIITATQNLQDGHTIHDPESRKLNPCTNPRYKHLSRGKHPRGMRVIDPDGNEWPSAAAVAESVGMTRQAVSYLCRMRRRGWRYVDA